MKRTMILLLAAALVVVSAAPVGAKKPDNPGKGPTNPPACTIAEDNVLYSSVTKTAYGAREYTAFWFPVTADDLAERDDGQDLCVEVTVKSGRARTSSLEPKRN